MPGPGRRVWPSAAYWSGSRRLRLRTVVDRKNEVRNEYMRTKRIIASWLLAVYLLTAFGAAYASLSCECAMGRRAAAVHALCACGHVHTAPSGTAAACGGAMRCDADTAACGHAACGPIVCGPSAADLSAPCCCDRHSTEIALYTDGASEEERSVRCAVLLLPPDAAAVCPCPAHRPAMRRRAVEPPAPCLPATEFPATGFRAPPASV